MLLWQPDSFTDHPSFLPPSPGFLLVTSPHHFLCAGALSQHDWLDYQLNVVTFPPWHPSLQCPAPSVDLLLQLQYPVI